MSFKVFTIPPFDKQLKRLVKKYPSLKIEFQELVSNLKLNPKQGTAIGNDCFKIRLAIASKGKGKRGGSRVITHFVISNKVIFLMAIYDKSEKDDLTDQELNELLSFVPD